MPLGEGAGMKARGDDLQSRLGATARVLLAHRDRDRLEARTDLGRKRLERSRIQLLELSRIADAARDRQATALAVANSKRGAASGTGIWAMRTPDASASEVMS